MTKPVGQNVYRVANEIQLYNTFAGVFECVLIYVTFTTQNLILFVKIITRLIN